MQRMFTVIAVLFLSGCATLGTAPSDRDAIIRLDQAYAANWARNDADAVMNLFASDAVIIPHDGDPPRVGRDAIRAFWFPSGAAPVAVTQFEHRVTDATVNGSGGVVWGRFTLEFVYDERSHAYEGNFLLTARKESDGVWRITHLTWNDPPPRVAPLAQ